MSGGLAIVGSVGERKRAAPTKKAGVKKRTDVDNQALLIESMCHLERCDRELAAAIEITKKLVTTEPVANSPQHLAIVKIMETNAALQATLEIYAGWRLGAGPK